MDNLKMSRDSVTVFRPEKHLDVFEYLETGGRYMGLFWSNKIIAWIIKAFHLLIQFGLILFAAYYYIQVSLVLNLIHCRRPPFIKIIYSCLSLAHCYKNGYRVAFK